MVVDAGGGTVDISTYRMEGRDKINLEEISAPECNILFLCLVASLTSYIARPFSGVRYCWLQSS